MRARDRRPHAKMKHGWHSAPLLLVGLSAACGDPIQPNRAPEASGTIPDQTVAVGDSVWLDVSYYFGDPDGDELTYSAATSAAVVAAAVTSGSTVTVAGVAGGSATVIVTARDPDGLSTQSAFSAVVPNRTPVADDTIPDQTVTVGGSVSLDLSRYFIDPDGDTLAYSAATSAPAVAAAVVSGNTVTIAGVAKGAANLTVTARDPGGLSARAAFTVTVVPDAEREALVALYEATDGPNWIENANWLTGKPLGEWYGVLVDDVGRVKILSLSDNQLTGTVPPELGNLASLAYLSLHNNELTGTIPPELGNLASLATLYLSANELTGAVPPELGNLASLATLTLKHNKLTGAVPDSFLKLDKLWGLWIEENDGLCVPRTSAFEKWVDGLKVFRGSSCDS